MKKYAQALVIGRFQPLCKNHTAVFDEAYRHGKKLLIGLGRPDYKRAKEVLGTEDFIKYQIKNLFSLERTVQHLEEALVGRDYQIVPVKDIFDPENYPSYIIQEFAKAGESLETCVLVGDNPNTYKLFEGTGIEIHIPSGITNFHATDVKDEITKTGKASPLLSCDLTNIEIKRIIASTKLLRHLDEIKDMCDDHLLEVSMREVMKLSGYKIIR